MEPYEPVVTIDVSTNRLFPTDTPIPRIEDFQLIISEKKYFFKLDSLKAYYQIPIAEEDKSKTAIISPFGLDEFNVVSFGIRNVAAIYQPFFKEVLRSLPFVFPYHSDILISLLSEDEHKTHLKNVFDKLDEYGLRINLSKSVLDVQKIEF